MKRNNQIYWHRRDKKKCQLSLYIDSQNVHKRAQVTFTWVLQRKHSFVSSCYTKMTTKKIILQILKYNIEHRLMTVQYFY